MSEIFKEIKRFDAVIVGSGCAGLNCADSLFDLGVKSVAVVTEGIYMGTSINTGSDKQTYYKLSVSGPEQDSVFDMAKTLFSGGCTEGYHALCEAAYSTRAFYKLVQLGVDFPKNEYGEYVGYRTDHDYRRRATSCGPLTSKFMAQQLIKSVKNKKTEVYEELRAVKIIVKNSQACGIIAVDNNGELTAFIAKNVIFATGGAAGIYTSSVFPKSQTGSLGVMLLSGASGVNLTEWQYGIASTDFRWNLSGTYMQVIPRFVSKDKNGNIREFLNDYIEDGNSFGLIFQKGYNWPFSPSKLNGENRSSLIDMAVYFEKLKGNEVFLDYTQESEGFEISKLPQEAYEYLKNSDVAEIKTPIARLRAMNERAYQLYLNNGIDLEKELLRIDVCAQHCNGGISCNAHYMSKDINKLFVCGECSGTFGIARPGGTALNNTQVSSLRAAEYIAENIGEEFISEKEAETLSKDIAEFIKMLSNGNNSINDILAYRKSIGNIMSEKCSFVRSQKNASDALEELLKMKERFVESNGTVPNLVKESFINYDILISAIAVAYAQKIYCENGFKSRGSFIVSDNENTEFKNIKCETDCKTLFNIYVNCEERKYKISSVSPIPESEQWFEKVYNKYYKNS